MSAARQANDWLDECKPGAPTSGPQFLTYAGVAASSAGTAPRAALDGDAAFDASGNTGSHYFSGSGKKYPWLSVDLGGDVQVEVRQRPCYIC